MYIPMIVASVFFPITQKAQNTAFFVSNGHYRVAAVRARWEGNGESGASLQVTNNFDGDFIGDGGDNLLLNALPTHAGEGVAQYPTLTNVPDSLLLTDGSVLGLALIGPPKEQPSGLVVTVYLIPVDPPPGG